MANWYYFDNKGRKKGPYSGGQIKELVKQKIVTRETVIENDEGQTGPARKIKTLPFPQIQRPALSLPDERNPFTAAPPVGNNPFTIPMPQNDDGSVPERNWGTIVIILAGIVAIAIVCVIGWRVIDDQYTQKKNSGNKVTWQPIELKGHTNEKIYAIFSLDAKRIVTSQGGTTRIWDAETGREIASLESKYHSFPINNTLLTVDARAGEERTVRGRFIQATTIATLRRWDTATGSELLPVLEMEGGSSHLEHFHN